MRGGRAWTRSSPPWPGSRARRPPPARAPPWPPRSAGGRRPAPRSCPRHRACVAPGPPSASPGWDPGRTGLQPPRRAPGPRGRAMSSTGAPARAPAGRAGARMAWRGTAGEHVALLVAGAPDEVSRWWLHRSGRSPTPQMTDTRGPRLADPYHRAQIRSRASVTRGGGRDEGSDRCCADPVGAPDRRRAGPPLHALGDLRPRSGHPLHRQPLPGHHRAQPGPRPGHHDHGRVPDRRLPHRRPAAAARGDRRPSLCQAWLRVARPRQRHPPAAHLSPAAHPACQPPGRAHGGA